MDYCLLNYMFASLLVIGTTGVDQCIKYNSITLLPYMTERLVGYTLGPSDTPICDYYLSEGWYKMPGFSIASSIQDCGTIDNWYMRGTLPNMGIDGQIQVCKNDGTDCAESKTIQVQKCGQDDYIFNLLSTDACPEAYCIESLTGATEVDPAPDISQLSPILVPDIEMITEKKGELVYYCDFVPKHANMWYRVDWSITTGLSLTKQLHRSQVIQYENEGQFRSLTKLTETHLRNNGILKLGYTILCSLIAKTSLAGYFSEPRHSSPKFCGLEVVTKRTLRVSDAKTDSFGVKLTVPFACPTGFPKCPLHVNMFVPIPDTTQQCFISELSALRGDRSVACGLTFYADDINEQKNMTVTNKIGASASKDFDQEFRVLLRTIPLSSHTMISEYHLDPVKVEAVTSTDRLSGKGCYAHSDPHMKSFDQKLYENQHQGTFVMYRNINYMVEVQIKTDLCPNQRAWCVRAVAVRAGKDVYVVNLEENDTNFKICEDRVLSRKVKTRNRRDFIIYLPTGTEVHLKNTWQTFLEVDIHPSLEDEGNAEGLCGNFDGTPNNDLNIPGWCKENNFNFCWRVRPVDNLFDRETYDDLFSWEQEVMLCTCPQDDNTNAIGGILPDTIQCFADKTKKCTDNSLKDVDNAQCSLARRKRDIHVTTRTNFINVEQNVEMTIPGRYKRATFSYNETTARLDCVREMNTTVVQMCASLPGVDIQSNIDNCVADALFSNSMEWTPIHIEAITQVCIKQVEFHQPIPQEVLDNVQRPIKENTTNANTTEEGLSSTTPITPSTTSKPQPIFTAELLESIKAIACPNDCSRNGKCENGVCICDDGFIDDDCSVDKNKPPELIGIPDEGRCDLSHRECARTAVLGRYMVESNALACKLKSFEIDESKHVTEGDPVVVEGQLDTFVQMFCNFPSGRRRRSSSVVLDEYVARGYRVSISNDGNAFSEEDIIVIFDSTCVDCTNTGGNITCVTKAGFCMDNGVCYSSGETSGCYTCLQDQTGTLAWTAGKECGEAVQPPSESGKLWIIGATVGPVVVIVLLGVGILYYISNSGRKARKKMGSVSPVMIGTPQPE